ncbi:MAG: alcohol dehydrogenase catalytic domain-containing protein [Promethearchaeia archaeon]
MRAAVFEDVRKISYEEDYPKPEITPDQVLVKVAYCAICGTDVTNYKKKLYQTPVVMGHEFSGTIDKIGKNVQGFQVGDKVVGINVLLEIGRSDSGGMGIFKDGGFAEYVAVHKNDLFHVPSPNSLKECSMIESFAVSVRAFKRCNMSKHQKIVIIGGGNIGLGALNILKNQYDPEYAVVVEIYEPLRKKAKELGADDTLPPSKAKLRRYFRKNGEPDYILDCAGNDKTFDLAINTIKRGGTIVLEGIYKGNVEFPLFLMNNKEITLIGTLSHDREDVQDTIDLFTSGNVQPAKLISDVIPLSEIQEEGFERYMTDQERDFIKILVEI